MKAKAAFKLPEGFDMARGSPLLCAGLTVFAPIKRNYNPNMRCAVLGIGGLGHLAVMYASKLGMTVTAFTTSKSREEEIKRLGASYVRSSIDTEELTKVSG